MSNRLENFLRSSILSASCAILFAAGLFGGPAHARSPYRADKVLRSHVKTLSETIGPRSLAEPKGLAKAERWVASMLKQMTGLKVQRLPYEVGRDVVANLEVVIPGTDINASHVVLGAHYDSVSTTPGADDNASGVAALLEVGRTLQAKRYKRTIRLVAFVNEEPPYFKTEQMGSLVYARHLKGRGVKVHAMIALDMLGYYSDAPGSQKYPPVIGRFYPSTANFLAFVGNVSAGPTIRKAQAVFAKAQPDLPVDVIAAHNMVQGIDFSDHWSFWQMGFPGFMITDTAFFRSAHYHEPTDTAATLDFKRLAIAAQGIRAVVVDLANQ
jgi:hypothetical protein